MTTDFLQNSAANILFFSTVHMDGEELVMNVGQGTRKEKAMAFSCRTGALHASPWIPTDGF